MAGSGRRDAGDRKGAAEKGREGNDAAVGAVVAAPGSRQGHTGGEGQRGTKATAAPGSRRGGAVVRADVAAPGGAVGRVSTAAVATHPPLAGSSPASSPSMAGFPFCFSSWQDGAASSPMAHQVHPPPADLAWDTNPRPPGGFMSFFQNQPQHFNSMNFHHVGTPSHWVPLRAPQRGEVIADSPPVTPTPHLSAEKHAREETIAVDSRDEVVRTDKQILWTPNEDYRLMSAWLNNSMNPIDGNDKRNEQYWADFAQTYNMTTPKHTTRNMKQAKDRWHKINKWTDLFHSAWVKAQLIYSSGHSDQDWIDKAHKFYIEDNKELKLGPFVLMDVWYAVRNEAKWVTYNKGLKKARKRKDSDREEASEDIDDRSLPRPIGQKKG